MVILLRKIRNPRFDTTVFGPWHPMAPHGTHGTASQAPSVSRKRPTLAMCTWMHIGANSWPMAETWQIPLKVTSKSQVRSLSDGKMLQKSLRIPYKNYHVFPSFQPIFYSKPMRSPSKPIKPSQTHHKTHIFTYFFRFSLPTPPEAPPTGPAAPGSIPAPPAAAPRHSPSRQSVRARWAGPGKKLTLFYEL